MSEKETFLQRLKEQDIKFIDFFPNFYPLGEMTEEEIYAELNRMDDAPGQVDLEIFRMGITFLLFFDHNFLKGL